MQSKLSFKEVRLLLSSCVNTSLDEYNRADKMRFQHLYELDYVEITNGIARISEAGKAYLQSLLLGFIKSLIAPIIVSVITTLITLWLTGR